MSNFVVNDAVWTQRYESLRHHFLGGSGRLPIAPAGLLLFLREGLAAWMQGWNRESSPAVPLSGQPAPRLPAASGWQRELTFLLAHLTTLHLQPIPLR